MPTIPRSFKELSVPLPPMLLDLVGVGKEHRFIALYYWYGKPTWTNANSCTPFPLYTVWQPYIQHEAIARQLQSYNFGADNEEPTHALLCDALEVKVYASAFDVMLYFLNNQQEQTQPIAVRHWEKIRNQALAYTPITFDVMQATGMLEMCLPPTPEHKQQAEELVMWLDKYV